MPVTGAERVDRLVGKRGVATTYMQQSSKTSKSIERDQVKDVNISDMTSLK
jgi:hypothetical protein